jgi:hypothetical protein
MSTSSSLARSEEILSNAPSTDDSVIHELGENDVLVGRGTGPNKNLGNIRFRVTLKGFLNNRAQAGSKSKLARMVVATIQARHGRFLRKLSKEEAKLRVIKGGGKEQGLSRCVYVVIPDEKSVEKTKQAMRFQRKASYYGDESSSSKQPIPKAAIKANQLSESQARATQRIPHFVGLGASVAASFEQLHASELNDYLSSSAATNASIGSLDVTPGQHAIDPYLSSMIGTLQGSRIPYIPDIYQQQALAEMVRQQQVAAMLTQIPAFSAGNAPCSLGIPAKTDAECNLLASILSATQRDPRPDLEPQRC